MVFGQATGKRSGASLTQNRLPPSSPECFPNRNVCLRRQCVLHTVHAARRSHCAARCCARVDTGRTRSEIAARLICSPDAALAGRRSRSGRAWCVEGQQISAFFARVEEQRLTVQGPVPAVDIQWQCRRRRDAAGARASRRCGASLDRSRGRVPTLARC